MPDDSEVMRRRLARLILEAWEDRKVLERFVRDPKETLGKAGIPIPPGVEVKVHENTKDVIHIVIPTKPQASEVVIDALANVVPGFDWGRQP